SSRRRHTRCYRDWSSDVCSSDLDRRRPGDPRVPHRGRRAPHGAWPDRRPPGRDSGIGGVLALADKRGGAGHRAPSLPFTLREDDSMTTLRSMLIGTAVLAGLVAVTAAAIRHPAASRGSGGIPAPELTNTSWLNADR